MSTKNKRLYRLLSLVTGIIVLAVTYLMGYCNGEKYDRAIRKNAAITTGTVDGYEHLYKHSPALKYTFETEGVKYVSFSGSNEAGWIHWQDAYKRIYPKIAGRSFPVYFSKDDPGRYNKLLVLPGDFSEFGLAYPDSLRWVQHLPDQ